MLDGLELPFRSAGHGTVRLSRPCLERATDLAVGGGRGFCGGTPDFCGRCLPRRGQLCQDPVEVVRQQVSQNTPVSQQEAISSNMSIFGMEYGLEFAGVRWIPCHEHTHLG